MLGKGLFSKVLLHFWKQEKVRRCQVWAVRRMLEDVQMELLHEDNFICQQDGAPPHCSRQV